MTWCIHAFFISYKLERTISHSNLITNKHRNEENIWSENSISILMHPGITFFWIWLFGGKEAEAVREEALMRNICLISHHLYAVEKLTVPGSSTLPEIALLNFNLCFYNLSTLKSCFTTSLFTRFLFMVTEIIRKVVLFCHHSKI